MAKNPFEHFGLSPELVGRLPDKDLFVVVKSMYRALMKTVHPDVSKKPSAGGATDPSVELNLAFEALNLDKDPSLFRRHRKAFAARQPKVAYQKSLALERQLLTNARREYRLATAYLERLIADHGWFRPDFSSYAGAVPFPLREIKLGLLDVAINQNLKMAPWTLGSNYKEMHLDAQGQLSVKPVGRTRFSKAGFIRLLGSIPSDELELMPLLERPPARFFKKPALNDKIGAHGASISVLNRINQDNFKNHALPLLKPMIMERAYLFSLSRPEFEETGCLTLEGMVVKIEPSSDQKTSRAFVIRKK